ncbi:MFS transporter [uncultured Amnibacterium sp.]|uniref:MFS transporter n=1 Tax=uncultured Amnibacterium sp. TaxID=1631851 RepID=UPI0035C9ADFD
MPRRLPVRSAGSAPGPVLAVFVVGVFLALTSEVLPVGLLSPIASGLHTSAAAVGLLVSVYAVIVAVASVPLTLWLRRWPRRPVLVLLLLGYAASTIVFGLAETYAIAFAARLAGGLIHAAFFSAVFAAGAEAMRPGRAGRGIAIVSLGTTAGFALGVPLGTALGVAVDWRVVFVVDGVALAVVAVVAALVIPVGSAASGAPGAAPAADARGALRRLLPVAVVIAVLTLGHNTAFTYISPLLSLDGIPLAQQSVVLLVFGLAGAGGVALAALTVDRVPRAAAAGGAVVTALCLVVLAVRPAAPVVFVVAALWGVSFAALIPLLQTIATTASPAAGDLAPAVVNSTFNVGIAGGALLGGGALLLASPALLAWLGAGLALASVAGIARLGRPGAA